MPIIVAGLGRCGTSLMMQMLAAGGVECVGVYPWFEDEHACHALRRGDLRMLTEAGDKAVKLLHADKHLPEDFSLPSKVIWLDRNPKEQAKSWTKMQRELGYDQKRSVMREKVELLKDRRAEALARVRRSLGEPLFLRFEMLLSSPKVVAGQVADHIGREMDTDSMARCVAPRKPNCLTGWLENVLMTQGKVAVRAPLMGKRLRQIENG